MGIIHDPITEKLSSFLQTNGQRLASDALKSTVEPKSPLVFRHLDPLSDDPDRVYQTLQRMMDDIEAICRQNDFARLLVLFRKMPHELTIDLLRLRKQNTEVDTFNFAPIYVECLLFGTNCILRFCHHSPSFVSNNDRYKFDPTEDELTDAIRLMLLSIIHRHEIFYMNSINRRSLTSKVSLDQLLDIYNRRLKVRWDPKLAESTTGAFIYPALAVTFPYGKRLWQCEDRTGRNYSLFMRNFLPVPADGQKEIERFAYLDTSDFCGLMGVDFDTWCKVWSGMNKVMAQNIAILWHDAWFKSANPDFLHACVERGDDYCETALGGGTPESIWKTCHTLLEQEDKAGCPTLEECRTVVERLTFRSFDGEVRFPEQPFVFYEVSPRLTFWDYLRHGGLLRCIARDLTRKPDASATRAKKGKLLEESVKASIEAAVSGVSHGKLGTKIKDQGNKVWDIDVGLVLNGVLFLIEAKNRQKKVAYYFDATEVSDRVQWFESVLDKQDEKLKKYKGKVRDKWQEVDHLIGAICLVCSEETEFIASFDGSFWLDLAVEIPRICLLPELVRFLTNVDLEQVRKHPAYVSFL